MLKVKCPGCGKLAQVALSRTDGYRTTTIDGIKNDEIDWGWEDEEWCTETLTCTNCGAEHSVDDTDDDTILNYLKEHGVVDEDDDEDGEDDSDLFERNREADENTEDDSDDDITKG